MRIFCLALLALVPVCPAAWAQTAGTYTSGMGYVVDVSFEGDVMSVYEPSNGKRSDYIRQADGLYHFTNPTNGIAYTMEVQDEGTLVANKPGAPAANGTVLSLRGTSAAAAPISEGEQERLMEIAMGYLGRAQSGDDNAQAWSFCGFAAMARAQGGGESQVLQSAQALRSIATSAANPCSDAIPDEIWGSAQ